MASKINVTYVEKDSVEDHLRAISSNGIITIDMVQSNGNVKCVVYQSSYLQLVTRIATNTIYVFERVQIKERMKREM